MAITQYYPTAMEIERLSSIQWILLNIIYRILNGLCTLLPIECGPGSAVGIATYYGLYGPGTESPCGRDFSPVQTGPGAHPAPCKIGTGSFPGVKCGRSVLLTTHPLLVLRSWKSRAIPLPTLWATPGL